MVEEVEVVEEEQSHTDAFDQMWADSDKGPDLRGELDEGEEEFFDDTPDEEEAVAEEEEFEEVPAGNNYDEYSWIDSLPEEQQEMALRLKHAALSDRGRVSALTRQNNDIKNELASVRSTAARPPEEVDVPNAQQQSETLRQLQEDYPELGKQLASLWAEQEATLESKFSAQLEPLKEAHMHDAQASEMGQLEKAAAEIFNTDETGVYWKDVVQSEDFAAWLDMQPDFIQETARTSNTAKDGIDVLYMFEQDYQAEIAAQDAELADASNQNASQRGDELRAERQRRKATTASPGSIPAGKDADGYSGDYGSMFDAMWSGK